MHSTPVKLTTQQEVMKNTWRLWFIVSNDLEFYDFISRGDLALPDFCGLFKNSKFKMADVQEKHESEHVPYEEIFADINSENLPKLSKEKL